MDKEYRLLLALGNQDLEDDIIKIPGTRIVDKDDDIDIVRDILNYETVDYIILNTVLSEQKSLELAIKAKETSAKIIALIENYKNKKFIASMVGLGVTVFLEFHDLRCISDYLIDYPDVFDFRKLQPAHDNIEILSGASRTDPSLKGKIYIGIFNICSGAGSTSVAVEIAENIANSGYATICVSLDGSDDFQYINPKKCKSEYAILSEQNLIAALDQIYSSNDYQVVIFDFGKIFDITSSGKLLKIIAGKEVYQEFLRCGYKIGLSFSDAWHEGKLKYFIENKLDGDVNYLLSGFDVEGVINCFPTLDLFNRNMLDDFIDKYKMMLGISERRSKKRRFKLGYKR